MKNSQKLVAIKLIHTIIWAVFVSFIFYIVYSGITGDITLFTWIAISAIVVEGLILAVFRLYCPLTLMARKYSDSEKDNFDIYLPNWLAKYNKIIFTLIYFAGVLLVLIRVL
jgi:hypothetical protein